MLEEPTDSTHQRYGIEVGADIADAINLDDFYVYDLQKQYVLSYFQDVLFKHLYAELGAELATNFRVTSSSQIVTAMFTQRDVFEELTRACEGVTRDFINILARAILKSRQLGRAKIDKKTIMTVAGEWFEKDKHPHLNDKGQDLLASIIDDVIGRKKARCFMVEQRLSSHPSLQSLYDFRVIHLIHKGYSHRDNPGKRFNIFILDYGTYVEMLRTHQWNQQLSMFVDNDATDDLDFDTVPYDDRRSIRNIVLPQMILDRFNLA